MSASAPLRLLIITADPLIRMGMGTLLQSASDLEVNGALDPISAARGDLKLYSADLALWIVDDLPDSSALADSRDLGLPILALTREELASVCWTAGARGVLKRDSSTRQIEAAANAILAGLNISEPGWIEMTNSVAGMAQRNLNTTSPVEELTAREQEVLSLLAEGLANKTIALRLQISENTVKFHLNALMAKLGAQSRTEAVVRAARSGLLML